MGAPEGAVGVVGITGEEGWGDLKSLTQQGQIPSKGNITRRQLLAADPYPRLYVAWYLVGLTQDSIKWPAIWAAGKCIEADEDEAPPDLFIRLAARGPEEVARLLRWAARWPNSTAWELPDAEAYDRAREFIQACGDMAAGWKAEKDRYVALNTRMQRGIRDLGLTARVQAQEEAEARARQALPDEEDAQPEVSQEPVSPDPVLDVPYEGTGKTLRQLWQDVLGQLQLEMPKATFDTWVKETELITHEEGMFVVGVPNAYAKDWLENRLLQTVKRTLSGIVGREVEVRFEVASKLGPR